MERGGGRTRRRRDRRQAGDDVALRARLDPRGGHIGLPKGTTAAEITAILFDAQRLEEVVAELSDPARGFAARQVLGEDRPQMGGYYHSRGGEAGAEELERCGLAFAFRDSWRTDYLIPGDVLGPLGQALATAHLQGCTAGTAQRWIGAPLQLAHDAAAVWSALHHEPARVKTDGEIYQRSWPKLIAALPAIDLHELDEDLHDRRLAAVLAFLREAGCLRLRLDSDSGWETKRELTATGELLELLASEPDELRTRLLSGADCGPLEMAGLTLLARLRRAAVSLTSLGRAAREFADEAARYPSILSGTDAQVGARAVAIAWLAGLAEIGVDAGGRPCAVRLACVDVEARPGPVAICQGNFELVVLTVPAPADRLRLELTCEAVPGQPHVYTITKRSTVVAERAGVHPEGAFGILRELAGELPQNVERTVAGWVAGHGPPLRVRTAMMLDAGDPATADRLASGPLAGLVAERFGEPLLAFPAARLDDVRHALLLWQFEAPADRGEVESVGRIPVYSSRVSWHRGQDRRNPRQRGMRMRTPDQRVEQLLAEVSADDVRPAYLLCDRHRPDAVAFTVIEGDLSGRDLTSAHLRARSERWPPPWLRLVSARATEWRR